MHAQRIGAPKKHRQIPLSPVVRIGTEDGPEATAFGFVNDVALGPHGLVFVVDGTMQRVSVFDSAGIFLRSFGQAGSGPGELMVPFKIVVFDTLVSVYDRRLGRVTNFDLDGRFRSSFVVPRISVASLARGPDNSLLATVRGSGARVLRLSLTGKLLSSYAGEAPIERRLAGGYAPEPGDACYRGDGLLVYASPWMEELAAIRVDTGILAWLRAGNNAAFQAVAPNAAVSQGAAILGLQCGGGWILLAYFELRSGRIYYDVFNADGALLYRTAFRRDSGGEFPGFAADLRDGRLATFKTKPFSQVSIYRLPNPDAAE